MKGGENMKKKTYKWHLNARLDVRNMRVQKRIVPRHYTLVLWCCENG